MTMPPDDTETIPIAVPAKGHAIFALALNRHAG